MLETKLCIFSRAAPGLVPDSDVLVHYTAKRGIFSTNQPYGPQPVVDLNNHLPIDTKVIVS